MKALEARIQRMKRTSPIKMETKGLGPSGYEPVQNISVTETRSCPVSKLLPRSGIKVVVVSPVLGDNSEAHFDRSEYAHKAFNEMPNSISCEEGTKTDIPDAGTGTTKGKDASFPPPDVVDNVRVSLSPLESQEEEDEGSEEEDGDEEYEEGDNCSSKYTQDLQVGVSLGDRFFVNLVPDEGMYEKMDTISLISEARASQSEGDEDGKEDSNEEQSESEVVFLDN
ncbi:hypothetical protein U1Q18_051479 [Sarracenia purpurea var. burkii]